MLYYFFFKQKTAYEMRISDWSSDVCSSDLQVFGVGKQMRVGVVVIPVEMAVLNRQLGVVGMTIATGDERRSVVELADPVIGRGCRTQATCGGVVEDAALVRQARDVVVHDPAVEDRKSTRLNSSH